MAVPATSNANSMIRDQYEEQPRDFCGCVGERGTPTAGVPI